MNAYTPLISRERLTAWRRLFHRHAETGMAEFWTTARLAEELTALGLSPVVGGARFCRRSSHGRTGRGDS